MAIILQIETATTVCAVALAKDGKVLAHKQRDERNIHAQIITLFIDELLEAAKLQYSDIDAIAVSSGPGSYTGLRIGVSTAKGLCFALDKPLIAIETLQSMAYGLIAEQVIDSQTLLCPMIDARRMEVYTALYDAAGNVVKPTAAEIIDEDSFADQLRDGRILFFGDGSEKCREALSKNSNAQFITGFTNSAIHLTQNAIEKFAGRDFVDVAYFEPFYLKDFLVTPKKV